MENTINAGKCDVVGTDQKNKTKNTIPRNQNFRQKHKMGRRCEYTVRKK